MISRRAAKDADRLAGVELMLPWPADLAPPDLQRGEERDATPRETAAAHVALAGELEQLGLEVVAISAAVERDPQDNAGYPARPWLAVHLVSRRFAAARRRLPNPPQPAAIRWVKP